MKSMRPCSSFAAPVPTHSEMVMQTKERKRTNAQGDDLAFASAVNIAGAGRATHAFLPHKFNVSSIFSARKLICSPSCDATMSFNFNSPIIKAALQHFIQEISRV